MDGHADLGAPALDRAAAAERGDRPAQVLPEWDQQVVVIDPVPLRQCPPKGHFGLFGGLSLDVTPAVRDPMDMRIDADPRLSIAHRYDKVSGLSTDPIEAEKRLESIGDAPGELGQKGVADLTDGSGFDPIETDRVDGLLDLPLAQHEHRVRPIGKPIQPIRGFTRDVILGLLAQDAGDQDSKRIAGLLGDLAHDAGLPGADSLSDLPQDSSYLPVGDQWADRTEKEMSRGQRIGSRGVLDDLDDLFRMMSHFE